VESYPDKEVNAFAGRVDVRVQRIVGAIAFPKHPQDDITDSAVHGPVTDYSACLPVRIVEPDSSKTGDCMTVWSILFILLGFLYLTLPTGRFRS
jgi:hypothetical protein